MLKLFWKTLKNSCKKCKKNVAKQFTKKYCKNVYFSSRHFIVFFSSWNSNETLTIFKLNEVSLKGDKMLSVDNRLRLDVCKGSGVRFDEMFGEPMALTSRSGENTWLPKLLLNSSGLRFSFKVRKWLLFLLAVKNFEL